MRLSGTGQTLVAPPLPVTGTYTLVIEPEAAAQGAATAVMDVLLDPGQALAVDGPTLGSTIVISGASARYTFAGTAGQNLGLGISDLALTPWSDATVTIYAPDGSHDYNRQMRGCRGTLRSQSRQARNHWNVRNRRPAVGSDWHALCDAVDGPREDRCRSGARCPSISIVPGATPA